MADITEQLAERTRLLHVAEDEIDRLRARVAELEADAEVGRKWRADSSLESWFPFTAEELKKAKSRIAELEAERADDDALRERMSDILKRTAIALRGPEPPLTAWSWHDLPERAAAAIASIDLFQRVAHNLADPRDLQQGGMT